MLLLLLLLPLPRTRAGNMQLAEPLSVGERAAVGSSEAGGNDDRRLFCRPSSIALLLPLQPPRRRRSSAYGGPSPRWSFLLPPAAFRGGLTAPPLLHLGCRCPARSGLPPLILMRP